MKKFFYFPPGRKIWLDIAVWLQAEKIAEPIFWLGDQCHETAAQFQFPRCHFQKGMGELRLPVTKGRHATSFTESPFFLEAKQICEKLMDRLDVTLSYSRIEREGLFYQVLLRAESCVLEMSPDFAFFPEAPHSYQQYIFYKVLQHYDVPIIEFHSASIAPVLIPKFNGRVVVPEYTRKPASLIEKARENVLVLAGKAGGGQPDYMIRQAEEDKMRRAPSVTWCRQAKFAGQILFSGLTRKQASTLPRPKVSKAHIKAQRLNSLSKYLESKLTLPTHPYVYFPLHYEPERTTCPDGGKYHDQIRALIELRASLADDTKIVVKEHPTQLRWAMNGYKGRSVEHYKAIDSVSNTILVSADLNSDELIEKSIFVASVAGTASLQSALRGKPAVVFGDAWFKEILNIHDFSNISTLTGRPAYSFEEVQRSLEDFIQERTICGLHNPSGEKRFKDLANDAEFINHERRAMRVCLRAFVEQKCR